MPTGPATVRFTSLDLPGLRALARQFPNEDAAINEIARLEGLLALPIGAIHVVSDVHGEHKKLQHILNNASGVLRPLVNRVLAHLSEGERRELLNVIYYPSQLFAHLEIEELHVSERVVFVQTTLRRQFELLAVLAHSYSLREVYRAFPPAYDDLFRELLREAESNQPRSYLDSVLESLTRHGKGLPALRRASRVIRNLSVHDVVVAGDLGDRGPRLDKVIDILLHQPRVEITWGNHDVSWMGACLGHEALIATVLRISLRYRRLDQLEEGYGISLAPLEQLAKDVYADDPADRFQTKTAGMRDDVLLARMQKAIALIQFKLEAQVIERHPEYGMHERKLLDAVDPDRGTIRLGQGEYALQDTHLPTLDPSSPFALSAAELACMARLRESFLHSPVLWNHMRFVARAGAVYLVRNQHLIFHGCVPVDDEGQPLSMNVEGKQRSGRHLFDALNTIVQRAFRLKQSDDLDMLWYLWTGPRSPLFGKDKMATFERYFLDDKATHKEGKSPYFALIHTPEFCRSVLELFDVDPEEGMIVNGHVPVKTGKGERPVKDSKLAITIDGAFSEAYGDRGYTLILDRNGSAIAEHHPFDSIQAALTEGSDIIPTIEQVLTYERPKCLADTERGEAIRGEQALLERLVTAYRQSVIREREL